MKHQYTVVFQCIGDLYVPNIIANDAEGAIQKARAKLVEWGHPRMYGNRVLEVICIQQSVEVGEGQ